MSQLMCHHLPSRLSLLRGAATLAVGMAACLWPIERVAAQQPAPAAKGGWSTGIEIRGAITDAPPTNTTVVPRTAPEQRATAPAAAAAAAAATLSLSALLTENGQRIDKGVIWRIYEEKPGSDGRNKLVTTTREAVPTLKLAAGDYLVNAAFGRAHLTRKVSLAVGTTVTEKLVLNAGGLRLSAFVGDGQPAPANAVAYEIFADERDQSGNRAKIIGGVKPGVIIRLNSGIYHIVSTVGDANASVKADVTVEAGKLTEVSVAHAAAKVTLKLVQRSGGEALADTHWTITTPQGEIVKESVGALPTHTLAPGTYSVSAKQAGTVYRRDFTLRMGQTVQVEVVMQ